MSPNGQPLSVNVSHLDILEVRAGPGWRRERDVRSQFKSFRALDCDWTTYFWGFPNGAAGTVGPRHGPTVRLETMKGRRASEETAKMARELRRRGLSLRQIARRAKTLKSTVYRLTKGISWEQESIQPKHIEIGKTVASDGTEASVHPIAALQVPRTKMETAGEEKSWPDVAQDYFMQIRATCPLGSGDAAKEQHVRLTVQVKESSELDEAEAYVRRMPYASKVYECVEFENLLDAIQSKDPQATYRERRKKALSLAVVMLRLDKTHRFRTL